MVTFITHIPSINYNNYFKARISLFKTNHLICERYFGCSRNFLMIDIRYIEITSSAFKIWYSKIFWMKIVSSYGWIYKKEKKTFYRQLIEFHSSKQLFTSEVFWYVSIYNNFFSITPISQNQNEDDYLKFSCIILWLHVCLSVWKQKTGFPVCVKHTSLIYMSKWYTYITLFTLLLL